jgi:prepilin-type N-terminal cleavage/methylation domain-containing protein
MSSRPCNNALIRRSFGLTLMELLVVIVILAILASAAIPGVEAIARQSQINASRKTIIASWRLALAFAQAQQQPVLWQIRPAPAPEMSPTQILILDSHRETLWESSLTITNLRRREGPRDESASLTLVIYPHGLLNSLTIYWEQGSTTESLVLPPTDAADAQEASSVGADHAAS